MPLPTVAPGAADTGVPDGTVATLLDASNRPYSADSFNADGTVFTIRTPGAVYDRWRFDAFVEVRAPGVVITNSHLRGAATTVDRGLLLVSPDPTTAGQPSATISDSTVSPRIPSVYIDGIRGSNFTARRVEITGTVDGVHIHGTATRTDPHAGNVTVEASWIHDLTHYANDPRQTNGSHNDNVQMVGGHNVTLRYNTLTGASNAAFMIKPDRNTITDVTLDHNWAGNGGCTFNIDNASQTTMTGIAVTNNTVYRTSTFNCGIIISKPITATLTNNTWAGTTTTTSIVWR